MNSMIVSATNLLRVSRYFVEMILGFRARCATRLSSLGLDGSLYDLQYVGECSLVYEGADLLRARIYVLRAGSIDTLIHLNISIKRHILYY